MSHYSGNHITGMYSQHTHQEMDLFTVRGTGAITSTGVVGYYGPMVEVSCSRPPLETCDYFPHLMTFDFQPIPCISPYTLSGPLFHPRPYTTISSNHTTKKKANSIFKKPSAPLLYSTTSLRRLPISQVPLFYAFFPKTGTT